MNSTAELPETQFLQYYLQNAPHLMWFLGAGVSRSSGLPTAVDIIWDLKHRYYCLHENQVLQSHDINNKAIKKKIQAYMDSKGFPTLWSPEEYSFYFDLTFGKDNEAQQSYIHEALSNKKVSLNIGHRVLAALMEMGQTKIVFTTNFDDVIETAFAEVTGKSLSTFHLEGSYAALAALNTERFPLYAKIHGDFRYQSIKNLKQDLLSNDSEIQKCFLAAATRSGLVVSGYSGRDPNVMSMFRNALNQNNAFPHGLFWTVPRLSEAEENVRKWTAPLRLDRKG
ncbi:MAG: SIR2 family protein [Smithella sp.]